MLFQSFGKLPCRLVRVWGFRGSLQGFGKFLEQVVGVRAGLSTQRCSCEHLVSMGAGLPTQQGDRGLRLCLSLLQSFYKHLGGIGANLFLELYPLGRRHHFKVGLHLPHLGADLLFELCSFGQHHQPKEGLYSFHSHFGGLLLGNVWTVSSVMSFLLTLVARSSYVYSVLPSWRIGRFRGTWSTHHHVGL